MQGDGKVEAKRHDLRFKSQNPYKYQHNALPNANIG